MRIRRRHQPLTVVVTGGTAGLGRAMAHAFAARGDRVAVLARGEEGLRATEEELRAAGGKARGIVADVSDWAQVQQAAKRIERKFGPIDVWVNNAMVSVFATFADMDIEEFERATAVDYFGFVHGTKAALELMVTRNRGVIVQVGSALAFRSIPLQSAYCGAKHAIDGFSDSVRTELLHDHSGVRLTSVHMPAMNTPQFDWVRSRLPGRPRPVAPIYQPELAARAVVYAADHPGRARYYVGASTFATVMANRLAPALLDRYLARTGFRSQQDSDESPEGLDNLYRPRADLHDAHGRFDSQSHGHSLQWWLTTHRRGVAAGLSLLPLVIGRRPLLAHLHRAGER